MARLIEITYRRSAIGRNQKQRRTVEALGLHRLHETVRQPDSATIRGMIHSIQHLLDWREVEEGEEA